MEPDQLYLSVSKDVYRDWQTVGVWESLHSDGDIAQLLLTLYTQQKEKGGEECMVRCVHCHSPLILYCSTCHCPSRLSLPTQLASPSLSCPPSALSSRVSDASAPLSVTTPHHHNTSHLHSQIPGVKDEERTADLQGEDDSGDLDDNSLEVDIVKTESSVDGRLSEPSDCEPSVNFRQTPCRAGEKQSKTGSRRKDSPVSDQSQRKDGKSTFSAGQNKTGKDKLRNKSKISADRLMKHDREVRKLKKGTPLKCDETVDISDGKSGNERSCFDVTAENAGLERRRRKPCASQDLEEGRVLPVDERRLAQIHVYDDSYFEHHRFGDDLLRCPGRRKRKKTLANSSSKVCGRKNLKRRCASSSPTNSESCNTDEETPEKGCELGRHFSLTSTKQSRRDDYVFQSCCNDLIQTWVKKDCEDSASVARTEGSEGAQDSDCLDKQNLRILVSAQKILPLRTSNGNYARLLYSYFECAHCKKAFTHKRAFNNHVQTHTRQNLSCTVCAKSSECRCDNMKQETKPVVQCEICGVHLKSLYALRFHIAAIHKNDRPFQCALCEKSFVLKTKLRTHMKYKHAEGGRLFHCDQCSYRAFDARGLKVHQTCVHSTERPFRCSFCPSAFAIKFYLDVHLRKHTGEKPFRCTECSQTFAQRPSLTRHRRNYHGLEPASSKKKTDSVNLT